MRNPTEMMVQILKNEVSKRIIDWVSPVYGESYVGLWVYEVVGIVFDELFTISNKLKTEANPITADLLLDSWEDYYEIPRNDALTVEQRQNRILNHLLSRGPLNPHILADAVSVALGGVKVEITENVAKNTFLVNIREFVDSLEPAIMVLNIRKPSHLIYKIQIATQTVANANIKLAVAMSTAEKMVIEVKQ